MSNPEKILHFAPNVPVILTLVDLEGFWDADARHYESTAGQMFTLPRIAVDILNRLELQPGEEIQIRKSWKGRRLDPITWIICRTPRAEQALARREEQARLEAEQPSELALELEASIERERVRQAVVEPPVPIKRIARHATVPSAGTGTDGPAAQQSPALTLASPPVKPRPQVIPWNVAFREVSRWVAAELKTNDLQWSDEAQQPMVCTCLIAEVKAGRISTWERPQ